jgi:hypothetical protein
VPCHPQSALAGLNARPRAAAFGVSTPRTALTARSRAMRAREPGQVRKEAALSGNGHVPRRSLARANGGENARGPLSRAGRTVLPEPGDTARDVQRCKIRAIRGKCTARRMGGMDGRRSNAPLDGWGDGRPAVSVHRSTDGEGRPRHLAPSMDGGMGSGSEGASLDGWARRPPARPGRACRPAASLRRRR